MPSVFAGLVRKRPCAPCAAAAAAARPRQHAGQVSADFSDLMAHVPEAQAAWNSISGKLTAEGVDPSGFYTLQGQFLQTYNGLTSQLDPAQLTLGEGISKAANGAAALIDHTQSFSTAANTVGSLVQAAASGQNVDIAVARASIGVLSSGAGAVASAAVAAGSISAGIGAAIVIGAALIASAVESMFGNGGSPSGPNLCGDTLSGNPSYVINCVGAYGAPIHPHSSLWRRFPLPNPIDVGLAGVIETSDWYMVNNNQSSQYVGPMAISKTFTWLGDQWECVVPPNARVIDQAFKAFHQLECDLAAASPVAALPDSGGVIMETRLVNFVPVPVGVPYSQEDVAFARFIHAFDTSWRCNAEYWLNGLQPPWLDAAVLMQAVSTWNLAHEPGNGFTISPRSLADGYGSVVGAGASCQGTFSTEYYYVQMLAAEVNKSGNSDPIVLHTGPLKTTTRTPPPPPPPPTLLRLSIGNAGAAMAASWHPVGSTQRQNLLASAGLPSDTQVAAQAQVAEAKKQLTVLGILGAVAAVAAKLFL